MRQFFPLALIFSLLLSSVDAQPPKPPNGKRWMRNEQFSDEFNGTELDATKWYDYNPGWKGRPPALFMPSNVSVQDGMLVIKNNKLPRDTTVNGSIFTIGGGAVASREWASYGFYECSMKASKIRMSSTFWFSQRYKSEGPRGCGDFYGTELDILECIGGHYDGSHMRTAMNSNSHFNYKNCEGEDEKPASVGARNYLPDGVEVSDDFHEYGCWWKDASSADMYLNGVKGKGIVFNTAIKENPFDAVLQMNMVTETYDWVSPPTDEDLADDSRNTTYYDWVRSYLLVDVDFVPVAGGLLENPGFETGNFNAWTGWGTREVVNNNVHSGNYAAHVVGKGAPEYAITLKPNTEYKLSCWAKIAEGAPEIQFGVKTRTSPEVYLGTVTVSETEYTEKSIIFTTGISSGVKFYFYSSEDNGEGWCDDFTLVETNPDGEGPVVVEIYDENIQVSAAEGMLRNDELDFLCTYQSNRDYEIHFQLFNSEAVLVGENMYPAYAGYGVKEVSMQLDSIPSAGAYTVLADIRPVDSTIAYSVDAVEVSFLLVDAVQADITILDLRDDSPLSDVTVSLSDSTKQSAANGMVSFYHISPGNNTVLLEKEGFESLSLENLSFTKDTAFTVKLVPNSYDLIVDVKDIRTGSIISGASVTVNEEVKISNNNGTASFSLYEGNYDIEVSASGHVDELLSYTLIENSNVSVALLKNLVDVKMVIKLDESSLVGASVNGAGQNLSTSSLGIVNFDAVEVDTDHNFQIIKDEKTLLDSSFTVRVDTTLRLNLVSVGIKGQSGAKNINVYPNPTKDRLYISGLEAETSFELISMSGKVVLEGRTESKVLDLDSVLDGIYILNIEGYRPAKITIKNE